MRKPPVKKNHCRQAEKVVQPEQIVKLGQAFMLFQGVNLNVSHGDQRGGNKITLVVKEMDRHGIQIPENEKKSAELYQSPPFFQMKLFVLDTQDEDHHGDEKEKVSQLMNHNAFFGTVYLGGVNPLREQKKKSCQRRYYFY